jgi:hypothetical protein
MLMQCLIPEVLHYPPRSFPAGQLPARTFLAKPLPAQPVPARPVPAQPVPAHPGGPFPALGDWHVGDLGCPVGNLRRRTGKTK